MQTFSYCLLTDIHYILHVICNARKNCLRKPSQGIIQAVFNTLWGKMLGFLGEGKQMNAISFFGGDWGVGLWGVVQQTFSFILFTIFALLSNEDFDFHIFYLLIGLILYLSIYVFVDAYIKQYPSAIIYPLISRYPTMNPK